ncbi:MAG: CGNR zinc finger domain-containing protein [Terriglobales bacterium]
MSRAAKPQLTVDFVNTVDWRTDPLRHQETLHTPHDLIRWSQRHGIMSESAERRLVRLAQHHPRVARQIFDRALALRDAIYRVLSAVAAEREAARPDLEIISREAQHAAQHMRLKQSNGDFHWEWAGDDALDRILWPIVQSTTDLLTSDQLARIRECEGPGCGWIIVDTTRNRSKRWCNMQSCGNRAKVKRFYERHKQETTAQ